jgi:glutathione S-transferase
VLKLVIGNKNYSSWSLRPWLYLRESGIEFEEVHISLFSGGAWRDELSQYTPAGRVPVLVDGDLQVWDSMAIIEHLLERHSSEDGVLGWPEDPVARAMARSISAEMHSGFLAVRDELPQNLRVRLPRGPENLSDACRSQIARIDDIWSTTRARFGHGGPWLFGSMSIPDVVYAPVALRFRSYEIEVSPESRGFGDAVEALESVRDFVSAARAEPEHIDFIDDLVPTSESPLVAG